MKNLFYYETEIGPIGIAEEEGRITDIFFKERESIKDIDGAVVKETEQIKEAGRQIVEYLKGRRQEFDLPLEPRGTDFQKSAWNALLTIPYGEVRSYKQMAEQVGNPKACRAIGLANNRNPIAIVIPCHRVIGTNGKLVGYGGGLDIKEHLLALEEKYR